LDFAAELRTACRLPLMVTGGFRSRDGMEAALREDVLNMVGIARPMCVETDLPQALLSGAKRAGISYEKVISPEKAQFRWFCVQLLRLGGGIEPDLALAGDAAIDLYREHERMVAKRWERPRR